MVKIFIANVKSVVYGLAQEQEIELANILSYETGGFGAPKTKKTLYDATNKTTYTGLVPKIMLYLKSKGIQYKVEDKREKHEPNANFVIQKPFTPRDYQSEIINRSSSREIIQAATGAGKTFIMANLIAKFNVKPVVVIAPKVSLAEQIKEEFEKFLGINIGIYGGGQQDIQDITICTPQSAPDELLENAKSIMYDEAHNLPANTIFDTAKKAKNAYFRIGVSATPWRDGGDDIMIEAALNIRRPNLSINASKLIKKGKLTPCNIVFLPIKETFEWNGSYHNLYQRAIIENPKRNDMIVKLSTKMVKEKNRTVLILIKNIEHGDALKEMIGKQIGVELVEFLSGRNTADERKKVLQDVKDGKVKVLIGSTIADEGLDLPILDTLILAGGGKSSTRAFQRVGRVLRLHENKTNALVFDFMDETKTFKRHSLVRKALYETEPEWNIKIV